MLGRSGRSEGFEAEQTSGESSCPLPSGRDSLVNIEEWKSFVEELRGEWRALWRTRIDDRVRAEGIASQDYSQLLVERGTVIIATRDYKPLSFREILEERMPSGVADVVSPSPFVGGVRKFIREVISRQRPYARRRRSPPPKPKRPKGQQVKKGGRGWLHRP